MNQNSILTDAELDLVVGGDMTSQVGKKLDTRKVEPPEYGPGTLAFFIGTFIGLCL